MQESLADIVMLRRLTEADASALAAFYNSLSAPSKRTFAPLGPITTLERCAGVARDNLLNTGHDLVAVADGRIVGWTFIWKFDSKEPFFGLAVADAYHGRGLGKALMTRMMQIARARCMPKVYLTVVQDNVVAWRLYGSQGFVRYGEFVGEDGLPYYRMSADLRPAAERTVLQA